MQATEKQSFDIFLDSGESLTVECGGNGVWHLFLVSADGEDMTRAGRFMADSRDKAMRYAEKLADGAFNRKGE